MKLLQWIRKGDDYELMILHDRTLWERILRREPRVVTYRGNFTVWRRLPDMVRADTATESRLADVVAGVK